MRILYIITTPDHGGAQVNVLDLVSGWSRSVEVVLATGSEGFLTEAARLAGVEVKIVDSLVRPVRPWSDWQAYRDLRTLIRSVQPDLVHCHSSKAGLIGRMAACAEKVPVVFTAHGWAFEQGISFLLRVTGLLSEHLASRLCRNQHVITVAEADRKLAKEKNVQPLERMTTVHNGVPDVEYRSRPDVGDVPEIIMVARFFEQKDHETLLRAVSRIERPHTVTLVGDGPRLDVVATLARQLGIEDRVAFLGDRHDVPELLSKAHLFVLSSLWEGFPISILEAMRAGLPVIACDVGGVRESVVHGETGLLIHPKDEDALRAAIDRLLSQPALRKEMGARGRAVFEEKFGKRRMLERTAQVYGAMLGSDGAAELVHVA